MLKLRTMLSCVLFLGSAGISQAAPINSADVVFVDGLPCNRACQSYMDWYRKVVTSRQPAPASAPAETLELVQRPPVTEAQRTTRGRPNRPKNAPLTRVAKKAAPKPINVVVAKVRDFKPADSGKAKPAALETVAGVPPASNPTSGSDVAKAPEQVATAPAETLPTVAVAAAPEQKVANEPRSSDLADIASASNARTTPPQIVTAPEMRDLPTVTAGPEPERKADSDTGSSGPADIASGSDARTTPQQVVIAPTAQELPTPSGDPASEQKVDSDATSSDRAVASSPAEAETAALASPGSVDQLVAILVVRPEIKSVADLTNKTVAIDARRSGSAGIVRVAIAAAGAAQVQMSEGEKLALNRVMDGDVPAAVLTLASPEEAEMFSAGMPGLTILRVPLSPSVSARRG